MWRPESESGRCTSPALSCRPGWIHGQLFGEPGPDISRNRNVPREGSAMGHGICIGARRQIGLHGEPHQTFWVCSRHLLLRLAISHFLSGFAWFVSHQPVFGVCHSMPAVEVLSRRGCMSNRSSGFRAFECGPGAFMMQVRPRTEVCCMLDRLACLQDINNRINHIIRTGSCLPGSHHNSRVVRGVASNLQQQQHQATYHTMPPFPKQSACCKSGGKVQQLRKAILGFDANESFTPPPLPEAGCHAHTGRGAAIFTYCHHNSSTFQATIRTTHKCSQDDLTT